MSISENENSRRRVLGHSLFDAPEKWDCTPEEREEVLSLLRAASEPKAA